jgi:hypothetical protein
VPSPSPLPRYASALLNAASLLRQDGDSAGALRLYRQAMETEATLMPSVGGGEGEGEEGAGEEEEAEGEEEEAEEQLRWG